MLRALEQIRRMRGGAQSHLMRCDDGYYYVVKFQNNPQHTRVTDVVLNPKNGRLFRVGHAARRRHRAGGDGGFCGVGGQAEAFVAVRVRENREKRIPDVQITGSCRSFAPHFSYPSTARTTRVASSCQRPPLNSATTARIFACNSSADKLR